MKENGKMIKHTDSEDICIQMVLNTRDCGKRINNTEWVKKHGLMEHAMKGSMLKGRKMAEESSNGLMDLLMMVNSLIIIYTAMEFMSGLMIDDMKDNGLATKCMVLACLHGLMGENMMEIITMIRNKVKEYSHGLMVVVMMVNGTMENSMARVSTTHLRERLEEVSGEKARGSSGSLRRRRRAGTADEISSLYLFTWL